MGFPVNEDGKPQQPAAAPASTYQYYAVKGRARDNDGQPINIDRVTYALKDEALDRALIEQEYDLYGDANHTLTWMDEPVIALAYTPAPTPTRLTDGAAEYGTKRSNCMPDNNPRLNQLGNPLPSPVSINTDDGATATLTWIFEHNGGLLQSILGIFRCRRELGDDPAAAFNHAIACFAEA